MQDTCLGLCIAPHSSYWQPTLQAKHLSSIINSRPQQWLMQLPKLRHALHKSNAAQPHASASEIVQQTSKSSAGQSQAFRQSQCPFAGSSSPHSLKQPLPSTSTPDDSNPLGLSVTSPSRDYLPFKDEAYTIDLKMDRIAHDDIFELDEEYEADMKRKAHILSTRPTEMLLPGVPGCELAQQEVLCVISDVLLERFPDRFQLSGNIFSNVSTQEEFDLADNTMNPMSIVARLVQEDVAVMQRINGKMILSCGAVVSPLVWSGSQKVGMDLAGIHDPVPHFNEGPALKFVSKIFAKGLKAGIPLARANWFIMDTGEHSLFADPAHIPPSPPQGPITLQNAPDRLFLRCERQVATRLPECGGVMFTFKTYIRPLRVLERRTEVMQRLLAAFLALPDEVVAYRHINANTRQVAIQYLQQVSNSQFASTVQAKEGCMQ